MKANVGKLDRTIRAIVGLAAIATWPLGLLDGAAGIVSAIIGVVLLATAALGWCPPYTLLGINTGARDD